MQKWYCWVSADPGFTDVAFDALILAVGEAKVKGQEVYASLVVDEMSVKKHIDWNGEKYHGYIDLGTGIQEPDSLPEARDALVFLVVAANGAWKVPIAYFFLNGSNGEEKANLIRYTNCRNYSHKVLGPISLVSNRLSLGVLRTKVDSRASLLIKDVKINFS